MNEQVKEYNIELQKLFVEFLAQDKDLFARVNGIIDPLYFDRELRKGVEFIQEHVAGYSALPTLEQIKATTKYPNVFTCLCRIISSKNSEPM